MEYKFWKLVKLLNQSNGCQLLQSISWFSVTDILRPGKSLADVPVLILGQHYLSHRDIGKNNSGQQVKTYVQEICTLDEKEHLRDVNQNNISQNIATAQISIKPEAKILQNNQMGRNSEVAVNLNGSGSINLFQHHEQYSFQLPNLKFQDPLQKQAQVNFEGDLSINCDATGLQCNLKFETKNQVKGSITRLAGSGREVVCNIQGCWDGVIQVDCQELQTEGILFDVDDYEPGVLKEICFHDLGPMTLPNLWSAIYDALLYIQPPKSRSAKGLYQKARKIAVELPGPSLPRLPNDSMVVAQEDSDDEFEDAQDVNDPRSLPPCYKELRNNCGGVQYKLQYSVVAIDDEL